MPSGENNFISIKREISSIHFSLFPQKYLIKHLGELTLHNRITKKFKS
jgi:hypothetical protein